MNLYLLRRLKKLTVTDIISYSTFFLLYPIGILYKQYLKIRKKSFWLICEDEYGANDNGYHFFKYMCMHQKQKPVFYVLNRKAMYYEKVNRIGNVIRWGSLRHWLYYLSAQSIISTQLGSSPSLKTFFPLEIIGILQNKRVFLQHGVLLNYYESLKYENNKLSCVICGAKPEYEYIKSSFGFSEKAVAYTGLARFDELHDYKKQENLIIIMPTWRSWLTQNGVASEEKIKFTDNQYYKEFNGLLNNAQFIEFVEKNNLQVLFYLHRAMQQYVSFFKSTSSNINIVKRFDKNIQDLLKEASFMITDYSSVSVDFAYMKKPLIYFQFDQEKFKKWHGKKGYFSYQDNGFGPIAENAESVIKFLKKSYEKDFRLDKLYEERAEEFFPLWDCKNCERIFKVVDNMLEGR
ncbi:CDP-glycerol glycerophosphotransferase family protein [Clostridium transplantifaecale]|uniref:CDP-glycerol glycerophosphotransferase family protein n=1 Tax=Clostridium transplantifaecale TaxID=2479838 RepID=UPI000F639C75|nr:CDP-glycerol glycerophosphotransferase family protein [Clostridium transplantifaecale]